MHKLLLLLLMILLFIPAVVQAQSPACTIDLQDAVTRLFEAQRAADGGDVVNATFMIGQVQEDLATLVRLCEGESFPLPERFESPDGILSFQYPSGWFFTSVDDLTYVAASSQAAFDAVATEIPDMMAGQQVLVAGIDDNRDEDETFEAFASDFQRLNFDEYRVADRQETTINRRQAFEFELVTGNTTLFVTLVDVSDVEENLTLIMIGAGASAEAPVLQALFNSFVATVRVPANRSLRVPGTPLDEIRYVSLTDILDSLEGSNGPRSISPDGKWIAYSVSDEGICLYEIGSGETECSEPLGVDATGRPATLRWSPDGKYVAFVPDFFRFFIEPDILVLETKTMTIRNLTPDGVDEDFSIFEGAERAFLDGVFTWGPDNLVYFIRERRGEDFDSRALYRVSPEGGDAEMIHDLSFQIPVFSVYLNNQDQSLDGPIAVSPDASQVAIAVAGSEMDDPANGIWVMDTSGIEDPHQLVDLDALVSTLPQSGENSRLILTALAWDGEGTGVYAIGFVTSSIFQFNIPLYIDVESGEVTPLYDLSVFELQDLRDPSIEPLPPIAFLPFGVALAPNGEGIIGFTITDGEVRVVSWQPGGEPQILLHDPEVRFGGLGNAMTTIASDGTIMGFILLAETSE